MPHLLDLPAEIRERIWGYVLALPEPTVRIGFSPKAGKERSVLKILTVCRRIHQEALHMFYRYNNLELPSTTALFNFLSSLHPRRRAEITAITLADYNLHYTSLQIASKAFSLLLLCPRLCSFRLDLSVDYSWAILAEQPSNSQGDVWRDFQYGLDCLQSLRGLTHASIRGITSQCSTPGKCQYHGELGEVDSPRADALRQAWMRPPLQTTTRVDRAIALKAGLRNQEAALLRMHQWKRNRLKMLDSTSALPQQLSQIQEF
ncbi:MAG: hypothetical protein MMC33_006035 [Icmadophila ericetorum]|nr:hypothetical protein [Icmadophila ericetorum]